MGAPAALSVARSTYGTVHAARALGRLLGPLEQLQGMLLDWVTGEAEVLRQRAVTALASVPAERLGFMAGQLRAVVLSPDSDPWVLAAAAAATPYLFKEDHELWVRLAERIVAGEGGALTASALAQGLSALWRGGLTDGSVAKHLRSLRDLARAAPAASTDELRGWIEVIATRACDRRARSFDAGGVARVAGSGCRGAGRRCDPRCDPADASSTAQAEGGSAAQA